MGSSTQCYLEVIIAELTGQRTYIQFYQLNHVQPLLNIILNVLFMKTTTTTKTSHLCHGCMGSAAPGPEDFSQFFRTDRKQGLITTFHVQRDAQIFFTLLILQSGTQSIFPQILIPALHMHLCSIIHVVKHHSLFFLKCQTVNNKTKLHTLLQLQVQDQRLC